ncbi:MAG: polysaccharide lyase family 1 protein [Parvularculaceae bacterium]
MAKRDFKTTLTAGAAALAMGACDGGTPDAPLDLAAPEDRPLAFASAQGHGRYAVGGRGGEIMLITTTRDGGPGSLRECLEAAGPRVCIFRVGGLFRFEGERPIIANPFITVAGQTAPGDGVVIAHSGGATGRTPLVVKDTHDVVIRHVRVRPDRVSDDRGGNDGVTIENSRDVILDHASVSWALDENVDVYGPSDDVTVSWSIFAEGVQDHDKCALISGATDTPQNISFLNNLCAHNGDRNPNVDVAPGSCVEVVNNVFYNGDFEFVEIWETRGGSPVSVVGNTMKAGPSTSAVASAVRRSTVESKGEARIFLRDNDVVGALAEMGPDVEAARVSEPPCPLTLRPVGAAMAAEAVFGAAGALPRAAVDERIVAEAREGRGALVDRPGGLPEYESADAPLDFDADGMADGWEREHGADAAAFDPWADADGDGVANLEEYLDELHARLVRAARRG